MPGTKLIMRLILIFLTAILSVNTANSQVDPRAAIRFEKQKHNFHTKKSGDQMEYSFQFTNSGFTDLLIEDVSSSCGCTVPEWPAGPVAPGQGGVIKVVYDSGRIGKFNKELTVYSNAGIVKLIIKGRVRQRAGDSQTKNLIYMARNLSKFTFL